MPPKMLKAPKYKLVNPLYVDKQLNMKSVLEWLILPALLKWDSKTTAFTVVNLYHSISIFIHLFFSYMFRNNILKQIMNLQVILNRLPVWLRKSSFSNLSDTNKHVLELANNYVHHLRFHTLHIILTEALSIIFSSIHHYITCYVSFSQDTLELHNMIVEEDYTWNKNCSFKTNWSLAHLTHSHPAKVSTFAFS